MNFVWSKMPHENCSTSPWLLIKIIQKQCFGNFKIEIANCPACTSAKWFLECCTVYRFEWGLKFFPQLSCILVTRSILRTLNLCLFLSVMPWAGLTSVKWSENCILVLIEMKMDFWSWNRCSCHFFKKVSAVCFSK